MGFRTYQMPTSSTSSELSGHAKMAAIMHLLVVLCGLIGVIATSEGIAEHTLLTKEGIDIDENVLVHEVERRQAAACPQGFKLTSGKCVGMSSKWPDDISPEKKKSRHLELPMEARPIPFSMKNSARSRPVSEQCAALADMFLLA